MMSEFCTVVRDSILRDLTDPMPIFSVEIPVYALHLKAASGRMSGSNEHVVVRVA
jgi:hypothetical protein